MGATMNLRLVFGLIALAIVGVPAASAQTFPSQPIRVVVPFPAGAAPTS